MLLPTITPLAQVPDQVRCGGAAHIHVVDVAVAHAAAGIGQAAALAVGLAVEVDPVDGTGSPLKGLLQQALLA